MLRIFKISDLQKMREIAGKVKLYVTLNTIIYPEEINDFGENY